MNAKLVTKSVEATIEPVADEVAKNPNGEFVVLLATPGEDREGDDLQAKGWQLPLPDHITFDTDHGMSVTTLVGSGAPTLARDGSIEVKGSYAGTEHGQTTRQLVNEGHIRTVSVTYLQRTTKAAGKTNTVRELLNGSFVAVPANPKAVVLSSKSLGAAAEATPAQIAHDAAVQLGADCGHEAGEVSTKSVEVTIVTKGLAGSVEELGDRVRKAVRDTHRSDRSYAYVRATFLDDATKGTVVYDLESYGATGGGTTKTLARDFTLDGSKVALDASPREVSLVTSVVDNDDEQIAKSLSTDGDSPVDTTDPTERAIELICKAGSGMTREAAIEFLGIPTDAAIVATEATAEVTTKAAAGKPAAAGADTDAAASPALRARALLLSLSDAAAD